MQRAAPERAAALIAAALLMPAAPAALAQTGDRPFVATRTALVEDEADVFGIELWGESGRGSGRRAQEWRVQGEYAFTPRSSLQLELGWARERGAGGAAREQAFEIEFKHVALDIARDGWGLGVAAGVEWDRAVGGARSTSSQWLYAPMSWRWAGGAGHAHVNLGVLRRRGTAAQAHWALAVEHEVARRTLGFVEVASADRLRHAGLRWWLRRERFALDFGVARRRIGDDAVPAFGRTSLLVGLAAYDIGW